MTRIMYEIPSDPRIVQRVVITERLRQGRRRSDGWSAWTDKPDAQGILDTTWAKGAGRAPLRLLKIA